MIKCLSNVERIEEWAFLPTTSILKVVGNAGTGKTTIAIESARQIGKLGKDVFACAMTGKAVHVLRSKGFSEAKTFHRTFYNPPRVEDEIFHWKPKTVGQFHKDIPRGSVLIVDEASMVDARALDLMMGYDILILSFGDDFQLPPISGEISPLVCNPDLKLDKVYRQKEGGTVLEQATLARNKKTIKKKRWGNIDLESYDKIICGTNATRRRIIEKLRGLGDVSSNDVLIGLQNTAGTFNGQEFDVIKANEVDMTLKCRDGGGSKVFKASQSHIGDKYDKDSGKIHFDFANAVTAHKSQGSEWERVLVVDESHVFRKWRWQWLYTAITRASDECDIAKGF